MFAAVKRSPTLLAALNLLLGAQSFPPRPEGLVFDGHYLSPQTETAYRFDCGDARAELRWRQERFLLDSVPTMSDALRVTLLDFSLPGRSVSRDDLLRIGRLFQSFAWVERAEAWCDRGSIAIQVVAMPKRRWIGYFERDHPPGESRPRPSTHVIHVSEAGAIRVEEPG